MRTLEAGSDTMTLAVAVAGVWWLTGYDALLLLVATQILQMVRQLTPLVRFDGYHVLADLTGVPDLFHRIKPTLLGVLPWRWKHPETRVLKPWARAVVTLWVAVVVPMLAFSLFTMVLTLPRILGTARASVEKQSLLVGRAWSDTDPESRNAAFARIAAPSIAFRDRYSLLDGLPDLTAHVAAALRFMPGIRLERKGDIRHCQGSVLADWVARSADGQERMAGTSVFRLGPDCKFTGITSFTK